MASHTRKPKILIVLCLLLIFAIACEKEVINFKNYRFTYTYKNYCGGVLALNIPNSFTPDDNGINDVWNVQFTTTIYDTFSACYINRPIELRDKSVLFFHIEVRDLDNNLWMNNTNYFSASGYWNGRIKNSNITPLAPPGRYLWSYTLIDLDNVMHEENGILHVLQ